MTEISSLKELLTTWGLPELFTQFQDESIGIEELKMMKSQHITELLRSHKLGIRIRFEYHFERWRRDQNKPLIDAVIPNYTHTHCTSQTTHMRPESKEAMVGNTKSLRTRATNTATVSHVSVATNTTAELTFKAPKFIKTPTPPPSPSLIPHLPPPESLSLIKQLPPPATLPTLFQPLSPPPLTAVKNLIHELPRRCTRQTSCSMSEDSKMVEIPQTFILPPTVAAAAMTTVTANAVPTMTLTTTTTATTPTTPNTTTTTTAAARRFTVPFTNDTDDEHLDNGPMLHIINSSGAKGQSLLDYYAIHKKFTSKQRSLLIQLIVNFFDMQEYHLSLKLSHNLEDQILRLFPSERLEYYRTEKRGKIYVKFCNMKRYKREKTSAKRKCLDGADGIIGNGDNVGDGVDAGTAMKQDVGIEYDDDEDDNMDDMTQNFIPWQHIMQHSQDEVQIKTETLGEGDYQ